MNYSGVFSNFKNFDAAGLDTFRDYAIFLSILIPLYVLSSLGLQTLAKRQGRERPWLAWIPFARTYLYGKIAFDNDSTKSIVLLILSIVPSIPFVFWAYIAFYCYAAYNLYKKLSDKSVTMAIYTALTGGILDNIFIFAIRNNEFKESVSVEQ